MTGSILSIPKSVIIIPARLASTRLPNKLLLSETGKPLIQHTWEAARRSRLASGVIVACDHQAIYDAVTRFGGDVRMTRPDAACGTDRIAEVAADLTNVEIIVNVQGDEPRLAGESIDEVIRLLAANPDAAMSTLATPIRRRELIEDPACVKVVFDKNGKALYFSRSVIPYPRNRAEDFLTKTPPLYYQHLGIYAYRREFLLRFKDLSRPLLETTESLEQLRVLYEGYSIQVGVVEESSFGIDTPEDYRLFVEMERKENGGKDENDKTAKGE